MDDGDGEPETERTCPACGGGDGKFECGWCHLGLVNDRQYQRWKKWRMDQRATSAAHSIIEGVILDVLKKLEASSKVGAKILSLEGRELLDNWKAAEGDELRRKYASDIISFNRKALDFLTSR